MLYRTLSSIILFQPLKWLILHNTFTLTLIFVFNLPTFLSAKGSTVHGFYNLDLCLSDKNIQAQFVFKLNDENFHFIKVLVEAYLWCWKLISYVNSKMINLISVKRSRASA